MNRVKEVGERGFEIDKIKEKISNNVLAKNVKIPEWWRTEGKESSEMSPSRNEPQTRTKVLEF